MQVHCLTITFWGHCPDIRYAELYGVDKVHLILFNRNIRKCGIKRCSDGSFGDNTLKQTPFTHARSENMDADVPPFLVFEKMVH